LKALTPQEFENFAYDLLLLSGMRNLVWRTPGADGGRDLEGEFSTIDFSGDHATQRWYIECKRYKSAIDWPTVHEKLAIAENHRADFLLFVTTSNFSSPCRDEVDRRNKRGGSVRIPQRDSYDWCKPKPLPASGFDQTSLRAALTAIRAITGQRTLTCDASESVVTVENVTRAEALRTTRLFALTETFGLLNASIASTSIRLVARKYDG
jgi:hypothetical protein